jgi:D-tagatose-1,6-bisphosphate aldolase subunit GatZ/KbaZ
LSAERTAQLCQVAESAYTELRKDSPDARPPLYVIGSDVPLPGGTPSEAIAPEITRVDDLLNTMALCESAFRQRGLSGVWERVVAVVVQPAVEHGARVIHRYVRENVKALTGALHGLSSVVFEAHATDYQTGPALREMVEDGFGILKVGPSLTSALREALSLLTHIEEILSSEGRLTPSRVPQALDAAMVREPRHWKAYYAGDEKELAFARMFGLSDRCRYYWNVPSVESAVEHLKSNLRAAEIPVSLLSQYLPRQYPRVRQGLMSADPDALIEAQIDEVLRSYQGAVGQR